MAHCVQGLLHVVLCVCDESSQRPQHALHGSVDLPPRGRQVIVEGDGGLRLDVEDARAAAAAQDHALGLRLRAGHSDAQPARLQSSTQES